MSNRDLELKIRRARWWLRVYLSTTWVTYQDGYEAALRRFADDDGLQEWLETEGETEVRGT